MSQTQNDPFPALIQAYDENADEREHLPVSSMKEDLRWNYLSALQDEGRSSLIDIGAGTGVHALFFQEQGLDLHCIDLSPALIEKCREKGLSSQVLSVLDLGELSRTFEAAFALNSLLHIPSQMLPRALDNIVGILEEEGLFYWGQYGGDKREGIYEDDHYQPKRFFRCWKMMRSGLMLLGLSRSYPSTQSSWMIPDRFIFNPCCCAQNRIYNSPALPD